MSNQQTDILEYQREKNKRFEQSLFGQEIQNIEPQYLEDSNNPNLIKIYLIYTFTQDIVATKEKIICSESDQELFQIDDVVECSTQQECSKKEIIVYVERSFMEDSKLLKSNYIQKLDAIKLPLCSANGIRIPNEYDIKQYFKFYGIKQEDQFKAFVWIVNLLVDILSTQNHNYSENSLIEDKVYESILQQITLEVALKLLLIAVQYESKKQLYLYKYNIKIFRLLKYLYYFSKGLLKESYDTLLQKITLGGMKPKQLQVERPNIIKLITSHYIFKINSTILYPLFKQADAQLFKFYKPQRENQYFKVYRNKDVLEGKDQLDYPHIYYLKNSDQETILVAYQLEFQGDILIFQEYQEQLIKYSDNYLGCIEYKNNGKEFILYDDGFPEYMENNFPQYVSRKKRKLLIIDYFSERRYDKPRQFTLKCLNLTTNNYEGIILNDFIEIITKEPHQNEQKYRFSLPLDHMAEVPSSRNYILIKKDEKQNEELYLTHGKINRHTFNLKIHNGLSIFQGFGISVASICSKPYD